MGLHKLTQRKAKILDESLGYMVENREKVFDMDAFLFNRFQNKKLSGIANEEIKQGVVSKEELQSIFHIADNIIKGEVEKPYSKTTFGMGANDYTKSFISNGGFEEIWRDQNIDEGYTLQLRDSTIDSNTNQIRSNRIQWFLTGAILISSMVYTITTIIMCRQQTEIRENKEYLKSLKKKANTPSIPDSLFRKFVGKSLE